MLKYILYFHTFFPVSEILLFTLFPLGGSVSGPSDSHSHFAVQRIFCQLRHNAQIPAVAIIRILRSLQLWRGASSYLWLRKRASGVWRGGCAHVHVSKWRRCPEEVGCWECEVLSGFCRPLHFLCVATPRLLLGAQMAREGALSNMADMLQCCPLVDKWSTACLDP